jgi:hypothetical protein
MLTIHAEKNSKQWFRSRKQGFKVFAMAHLAVPKKGTRSLLLLVVWHIWLERNNRTFQRQERSVADLLAAIKAEARLWGVAGAKHLLALLPML